MKTLALIPVLLLFLLCQTCGATSPPASIITINPTPQTWTEDWSSAYWWSYYFGSYSGIPLSSANLHYDAALGNYCSEPGNWSAGPAKKWDRTKPITVYHKFRVNSGSGFNVVFYSGEAEYWGFESNGTNLGYYVNASYYSGPFSFSYGQVIETLMEFDGNQTTVHKARVLGNQAWTTIGTITFKPTVNPSFQVNQWGASVDRGEFRVTGSEVWEVADNSDDIYWLTKTNSTYEWGIEYNSPSDFGKAHYLTMGGGVTVIAANGAAHTWIQNTPSTAYAAGAFSAVSAMIAPTAGYKYGKLEAIGALRGGGAGATLTVSIYKPDGTLVPSSDLGGAANPIAFTTAAAVQKTVDLSAITYANIYLKIDGYSPTAVNKLYPDTTGTTGPPILKQAAVIFTEGSVSSPATAAKSTATMRASFR